MPNPSTIALEDEENLPQVAEPDARLERIKELEALLTEKQQVISDLNAALTASAKNAEIAKAAARYHRAGVAYEEAENAAFAQQHNVTGVPDSVVEECATSNCELEKLLADAGLIEI